MGGRRVTVTVVVVVLVLVALCISFCGALANNSNSDPGGPYWGIQGDDDVGGGEEQDQLDGGFSSLDSMLQWAIGNSDPTTLKKAAQDVHSLSTDDLMKRQLEMKDLMDKLKVPSDAQLMQIAIEDLKNVSLSLEDHRRALHELLILVEMIDNANNLDKFGGLAMVIQDLVNSDQEIRIISAWILGKASQNNPVVQKQTLELDALAKLVTMAKSSSAEEATKALYAISALIRNNVDGQELFYVEGGDSMLQDIMSNSSIDIRLLKKSAFLVADLAECQLELKNKDEPLFFSNRLFLKSVVDLTTSTDLDLQEKALMAIKSLLQLNSTEALDFRDFCHLDSVLERMKDQLQQLIKVEDQNDFLQDMESLRREVESLFRRKLEKVMGVPT